MKTLYVLLLCAVAFPVDMCSADTSDAARELVLFDFECNGGGLNLGREFPGAKAEFVLNPEAAHDGQRGGRLSFDLTRGAYVAWAYSLPRQLEEGARSISVWVRVGTAGHQVHCKTRDSTGQDHIRFLAAPPPGKWQRLSFDIDDIDAHWGGANDGKIHWPITFVQIGVEARGENKVSHMDIDMLSVRTTASPKVQPGALLELDCRRFGHLFERDETPRFTLRVRGTERRPAQCFQGEYSVCDWMDREVARNPIQALTVKPSRSVDCQITPAVASFGAFCLNVNLLLTYGNPVYENPLDPDAYAIEGDASLNLTTGAEELELADLMGNRNSVAASGGVLTLNLTESPVYLLGADREQLLNEPR